MEMRLSPTLPDVLTTRVKVALLGIVDANVVVPGVDFLASGGDSHVATRRNADDSRKSCVEILSVAVSGSTRESGDVVGRSVIGMKDVGQGDLGQTERGGDGGHSSHTAS